MAMNPPALCALLTLPPGTPATVVLQTLQARRAELRDLLQQEGISKPVRIQTMSQLGELEAEEIQALTPQLEQIARAETLWQEIETDLGKPNPAPGVIELLSRKLIPIVASIADEEQRLPFELRLAELASRIKPPPPPPPPPPPSAPPFSASSAANIDERLEGYFRQIEPEAGKSQPSFGRAKIWLEKIEQLIEQIPDPDKRFAFEERVVEIKYRLKGESRAPWSGDTSRRTNPIAPPLPPSPSRPVSPPGAATPAAGLVLEFKPRAEEGTLRKPGAPIVFVARPRFVIGRQRNKADFVAWFLPESPANQLKTDSISRVNTTFQCKGAQLWVQDGEILPDGQAKPSAGSFIDGHALEAKPLQLNFTKERRLRVGQAGYEISVLQLPATLPAPSPAAAADMENTASAQATVMLTAKPTGCVRFHSVSCREVVTHAVWIFTHAAIGAGPENAVVLEGAALPSVALHVFHAQGGFWLGVPAASPCKVQVDGATLTAESARPLGPLQVLRLGALQFDLKVSP